MRRISGIACAAAFLGLATSALAQQNNMRLSINHIVTNGLPHPDCLRQASRTFSEANLREFGKTSEAVWADTGSGYSATIYCLATRDVAVVAVYGPDGPTAEGWLNRINAAWQRMR